MKIDVGKLDSTIAKLQMLRELATDPSLAPFVATKGRKSATNGSGVSLAPSTFEPEKTSGKTARGTLRPAVLAACRRLRRFTIKEVLAVMVSEGFAFGNPNKEKSVSNVIIKETGKTIRVAERHHGKKPAVYEMMQ